VTTSTADTAASPLAGMNETEMAKVFETVLSQAGGTARAMLLRSQAVAKQREAVALLREADHAEYVEKLHGQLAEAEKWLTDNTHLADDQVAVIDELIKVERAAHDRVRDAEENLRRATETHQLLSLEEAPATQLTDALLRVGAAREVLESVRPPANRETAEKSLGGVREVLQQGRTVISKARGDVKRAEATPDEAPRSTITLLLGWQQAITEGTPLTIQEREVVRGLVESMTQMVGADKSLIRKGYDQAASDLQQSFNDRIRAVPGQASQVVVRGGGRHR
jgi:hypothetical protein